MLTKLNTPALALFALCSERVEGLGWSNSVHKLSTPTLALLALCSDSVEAFGWSSMLPTATLALHSLFPEQAEAASKWTQMGSYNFTANYRS